MQPSFEMDILANGCSDSRIQMQRHKHILSNSILQTQFHFLIALLKKDLSGKYTLYHIFLLFRILSVSAFVNLLANVQDSYCFIYVWKTNKHCLKSINILFCFIFKLSVFL